MIPLIDGDIITYRAGFSAEVVTWKITSKLTGEEVFFPPHTSRLKVEAQIIEGDQSPDDWEFTESVKVAPVEFACQAAKVILKQMLSRFNAEKGVLYLTSNDKTNYRFDVAKTAVYKGNRKKPKPVHYDAIRDYLISTYNAKVISGMEADDALGIHQVGLAERGKESVICSIDKDLLMIPGWHYNFVKDEMVLASDPGELSLVVRGKKKAIKGNGLKWFFAQMLLGDSADNIKGVHGLGAVGVFKILDKENTEQGMSDVVRKIFNDDERFIETSKLLWIQREYGVLWEPNWK